MFLSLFKSKPLVTTKTLNPKFCAYSMLSKSLESNNGSLNWEKVTYLNFSSFESTWLRIFWIFSLGNNEVNLSNYDYNKGIKLFDNIELKFKPFFYGKRIKEFYPGNNSFACNSSILGVLADGNVVPCCLAYDNSISIGNVKNKNLISMIKENKFLKDLRTKGGDKHITCKKCFGEPTKRGSVFRSIFNMLS